MCDFSRRYKLEIHDLNETISSLKRDLAETTKDILTTSEPVIKGGSPRSGAAVLPPIVGKKSSAEGDGIMFTRLNALQNIKRLKFANGRGNVSDVDIEVGKIGSESKRGVQKVEWRNI